MNLKADGTKHLCNISVSVNLKVFFVKDCLGTFLSLDRMMYDLCPNYAIFESEGQHT